MTDRPDNLAPETVNDEQEDEAAQAQTIAEQAQARGAKGLGYSDKAKGGIRDEDDVQDIVDHMNQMDTSGTIDMSAYDGEETMDDLESRYGKDNAADPDFSDDDS